ncbi:MAG TPA: archaemetzincin [Steroidobacteraceae bacterium]|nr:archaemetzincin [Steroidobacteraceae bacterium]
MAELLTRRSLVAGSALAPLLTLPACAPSDPIRAAMNRIRRQARPKIAPGPQDWLAQHKEPGQTFAQFRQQVPKPAIETWSTLRLVPIGPVTPGQQAVLAAVRDLLPAFFGLALAQDDVVPLDGIPADAQRLLLPWEERQLLTPYLLNDVLMRRRRPTDAAVLGITAVDLWPGEGWNFVFGQASLKDRVGVWSMARSGDPDESAESRRLCTLRTAKTAMHETGHMFGIRHCIAYECGMNGSNHSGERDRQPLEFCPECQAKLWWTLKIDPVKRSRELASVAHKHALTAEAEGFARQAKSLAT